MCALPTTAFDQSKTIIPRKSFATFTPVVAGVDGTPVQLVGKLADYGQTLEKVMRKVPSADGLLRPDRIVAIEHQQELVWEAEDLDKVSAIFTGIQGGFKTGRVQLWVTDPDDAASTAAVKSNDCACSVELDGGISFKTGELTVAKLKFTMMAAMTLSLDQTA